jgi:Tfp pilus assembly protein PilF
MNSVGLEFLRAKNNSAAVEMFKWMIEVYPQSYNSHLGLADAYKAEGLTDLAIKNIKTAIEKMKKISNLTKEQKDQLEKSCLDKINQLNKGKKQ